VTYEPVSPIVHAGDQVARGQLIGHVSDEADSCGARGSCLHWGAHRGATYLDPMRLLDPHPPVRLLPLWVDGVVPTADAVPSAPPRVGETSAQTSPATSGIARSSPKPVAGVSGRPTASASRAALLRSSATVGGGVVLAVGAAAGLRRRRRSGQGVSSTSAQQVSRVVGARPWCASGKSGFP
jgi:hypothetical protein